MTAANSPAVAHLTTEGLLEPLLIDTPAPRFSWRLTSTARGARQTAYQVRITELAPNGQPAAAPLETPRIESDQSQWIAVGEFTAKPRRRYAWQVRVWSTDATGGNGSSAAAQDSGWSEPANFETGFLRTPWPAAWLGDGLAVPRDSSPRARYFRTEFETTAAPVKARLYLSAFGAAEPWLNGSKVGDDYFVPGWPDYRRRVFYVAYDVTARIQPGRNALGLILGDGWYSSTLMRGAQSGSQPLVSAMLELTDAAGKVTTITTNEDWQWAEGPIVAQSIYHGETFDARRDDAAWSTTRPPRAATDANAPVLRTPVLVRTQHESAVAQLEGSAAPWQWRPAHVQGVPAVAMTARFSPPVRRIQEIRPVSRREIRPGVFLYDLGQNMVGWVRLKLTAPAGQEVQLRFAEMLEAPDRIHIANLRRAQATARYIAGGKGIETWEPRFTFFGFRYVELSGLTAPADDAITGVVVHTDLPRIGSFACSDPLLNRLFANTLWGQKGNFLEVPTDCPQRDERLGWTGDAQVFAHTANYNYASGAFYRQWLAAVRDSYRDEPNGVSGFADVAPDTGLRYGSAGWSDAAVVIPYVTWLHTGDRRVLEENLDAVQTWVEAQARDFPDGIRRSATSYGDWLAPNHPTREGPTPYVLIATAYFAHDADLAARMAAELGRTELAERNRALFAHIKRAFRREFIADDGRVHSDEQTAYLLALGFDLVPAELREKCVAHLVRTIAAKNDHLATGFLGTPLLTPVLTAVGQSDLAYRILRQETYPGWLFSVKNGATTIWERWDSWTPENGFHPHGMNSFNHYAYGSVVGWFYDTIAGLRPDAAGAGWKTFEIAPTPGGDLTHAEASLETPYGRAGSQWRIVDGHFELTATVPPNTTARVSLPAASPENVTEEARPLRSLGVASEIAARDGRVRFVVPAGTYRFRAPVGTP